MKDKAKKDKVEKTKPTPIQIPTGNKGTRKIHLPERTEKNIEKK